MKYEYRYDYMFYDGKIHYHIERREIGSEKWKLLFGGLTYESAKEFLKDPESIEDFNKSLKMQGIFLLVLFCTLAILGIISAL